VYKGVGDLAREKESKKTTKSLSDVRNKFGTIMHDR